MQHGFETSNRLLNRIIKYILQIQYFNLRITKLLVLCQEN